MRPKNGEASTWKVISKSLGIDSIHDHIHLVVEEIWYKQSKSASVLKLLLADIYCNTVKSLI